LVCVMLGSHPFFLGLGAIALAPGPFPLAARNSATLIKAVTCESCKVAKVAAVARVGHHIGSASTP
jgi:hypothetical protein